MIKTKILYNVPYPSIEDTKIELNYLKNLKPSPSVLKYSEYYNNNLFNSMSKLLHHYDYKVDAEEIKNNLRPYEDIGLELKEYYKRPRPMEFAEIHNLEFTPRADNTYSGSYSYPSGHVLGALMFSHIYGKKYPHLKHKLLKYCQRMKISREVMGVHFPSDCNFSFYVYNKLKNKL